MCTGVCVCFFVYICLRRFKRIFFNYLSQLKPPAGEISAVETGKTIFWLAHMARAVFHREEGWVDRFPYLMVADGRFIAYCFTVGIKKKL